MRVTTRTLEHFDEIQAGTINTLQTPLSQARRLGNVTLISFFGGGFIAGFLVRAGPSSSAGSRASSRVFTSLSVYTNLIVDLFIRGVPLKFCLLNSASRTSSHRMCLPQVHLRAFPPPPLCRYSARRLPRMQVAQPCLGTFSLYPVQTWLSGTYLNPFLDLLACLFVDVPAPDRHLGRTNSSLHKLSIS
ncbi:hypothetical protein C8J57DRAFT_1264329 [Mycena rebaudengoi]|nr:hypothetical protein C8J57DRAFT_1264329 [Mycena rebaudengoi]